MSSGTRELKGREEMEGSKEEWKSSSSRAEPVKLGFEEVRSHSLRVELLVSRLIGSSAENRESAFAGEGKERG